MPEQALKKILAADDSYQQQKKELLDSAKEKTETQRVALEKQIKATREQLQMLSETLSVDVKKATPAIEAKIKQKFETQKQEWQTQLRTNRNSAETYIRQVLAK